MINPNETLKLLQLIPPLEGISKYKGPLEYGLQNKMISTFYFLILLFYGCSRAQGVSGSGVVCRWWLCHLLHCAGQKHPLPSPSGNPQNFFFTFLSKIISSGNMITCSGVKTPTHKGYQTFVKIFVNLSI